MSRVSVALLIVVAIIGGCTATGTGDVDATTGTSESANTVAASTSTSIEKPTTSTTAATTTTQTPQPPETLFAMTRSEIIEASEPVLVAAQTIGDALEADDREAFAAAFEPDAYVIDPVVPSLRPDVQGWYGIFQNLCVAAETTRIYANVGGSTSRALCTGFYDTLVMDPPEVTIFLSHVLMEESRGTVMLNRIDAAAAAAYPAETSDAIGFPTSRERNVVMMAETAERFVPAFVAAWQTADLEEIAALYAPNGVRIDGFAGLDGDPGATLAWIEAFLRDYDGVALEIKSITASAPGPGIEYILTLQSDGSSCVMEMASVWELDEDDRIVREHVYYHPDALFDCGWEAAG